ncbi:MAG: ComEC/Rec2 family competence protein, partial [Planctomycetota bacterium]
MSTADGDPGPWRARAVEPAFVSARSRAWAVLGCAMVGCWVGASHPGGMSSRVWFLVALVLAVALLAIGRRYWARFGRFALLFAIVCAMAGWSVRRGCEPAADRADQLLADGAVVTLEGTIVGGPEQIERPDGPGAPGAWRADRARFDLKLSAILEQDGGRVHAGGVVGVRAPIDVLGVVSAGESCTVTGVFRAPGGPSNPGEPDWRRLGNERGMGGSLSVPDTGLIEPRDGARDARGVFIGVRTRLRDRARRALGEDPSGVLGALVLGERDASFDETYRVFQRAGVAHVLAVSGFHLALLGGFVALAIRATGERGRLETVGVLVVVIAMLFMVPARAPILRAGVLVIALLIGDAAGRRNDRLALLAWAGVGLLIWRPSDASGLGFLLSVGVTATLLGLAERQQRERRAMLERAGVSVGGGVPGAAWRWLRGAARVNVSCWAVATPTIVASTGVCSLIAPVATLLVVPMAGLLLVCGWAQAALGVLWPGGAERTAPVVGWLGEAVGRFATWIDGIPWSSVMVSGVGWIWCALTKMCISALLFAPRARRAGVTLLCCCVVYAAVAHARSGRVPGLRADMIDVGDGTAIL